MRYLLAITIIALITFVSHVSPPMGMDAASIFVGLWLGFLLGVMVK